MAEFDENKSKLPAAEFIEAHAEIIAEIFPKLDKDFILDNVDLDDILAIYYKSFLCGVTAIIYRRVLGFQRKLIAASNESVGVIKQIFTGLAKFRVRGAEEQAFYLWSKVFGKQWQWKWNLKLRWQSNYNGIIASIQPFILTMCLYYIAVYSMDGGAAEATKRQATKDTGIGYAQFLAFQAAFSGFNATLSGVIPFVGQFFSIQPHLKKLRPIINEIAGKHRGQTRRRAALQRSRGATSFICLSALARERRRYYGN